MSDQTFFADILLPLPLPATYTYRIPREMNDTLSFGKRVVVPFGKNKLYSGLVVAVHDHVPPFSFVKYIVDVIDDHPVVTPQQFELWQWIAQYYMCTLGEVMSVALPSALKLAGETQVMLHPDFTGDITPLNEKEVRVAEALTYRDKLTVAEIAKIVEVQKVFPIIKNLVEKKVVIVAEEIHNLYKPKQETYISLTPKYQEDSTQFMEVIDTFSTSKKTEKQAQVLLAFYMMQQKSDPALPFMIKKNELIKMAEVSASSLQTLIQNGILMQVQKSISRLIDFDAQYTVEEIQFSEIQMQKLEEIKKLWNNQSTVLLHGVTGSGKTEIYIKLIDEVLAQGKQVLYLLPEIALTSQIINRLRKYFGNRVGVYHSKFNELERVEIWNRVLPQTVLGTEHYDLILGARSSLLLPFSNLGLIIVDEEHDGSYKQMDPAPRYHARDSAIVLANIHKAKTLLGTATPSLESYFNVRNGKFGLVELKERFSHSTLPEIWIENLVQAKRQKKMEGYLSHFLLNMIREALEKEEQIILFQNRRGYSVRMLCNTCFAMPTCEHCDVTLTYHKHSNLLKCHYCGYAIEVPKVCPHCQSHDVEMKGFGTELVEEKLSEIFPDAVVTRMDLDTTRNKYSYQKIIADFEQHKIDILVGTQMVTKGLDFDKVSVVGILDADNLLSYPDFRAFERAYQIIAQVSGRAGRKDIPGQVVVQTHQPNHPALQYVVANNYWDMYVNQIEERTAFRYPPVFRMIKITLKHHDVNILNKGATEFGDILKAQFPDAILGPEFPLVSKIQNQFLKEIYIKFAKDGQVENKKRILQHIVTKYRTESVYKAIRIVINVDC
jgi:primosomal protein N' (replication factor Y)